MERKSKTNQDKFNHDCKKPVAEVAVLPEKNSNRTENFGKI